MSVDTFLFFYICANMAAFIWGIVWRAYNLRLKLTVGHVLFPASLVGYFLIKLVTMRIGKDD